MQDTDQRADSSPSLPRGSQPSGDGAGLGLSIVKRIVDRCGGSIQFENVTVAERTGLRVIVRLPAVNS